MVNPWTTEVKNTLIFFKPLCTLSMVREFGVLGALLKDPLIHFVDADDRAATVLRMGMRRRRNDSKLG